MATSLWYVLRLALCTVLLQMIVIIVPAETSRGGALLRAIKEHAENAIEQEKEALARDEWKG